MNYKQTWIKPIKLINDHPFRLAIWNNQRNLQECFFWTNQRAAHQKTAFYCNCVHGKKNLHGSIRPLWTKSWLIHAHPWQAAIWEKYLRLQLLPQLCYSKEEGKYLPQVRLLAAEPAESLQTWKAAQLLKTLWGHPHCEA